MDKNTVHVQLDNILSDQQRKEMSQFVSNAPCCSYLQQPGWLTLSQTKKRHHYEFLRCRRKGTLVATAIVRFTKLVPGRYLASLRRGPVTHSLIDLAETLPHILRALRQRGVCSVQLNPWWQGEDVAAVSKILEPFHAHVLPKPDQGLHTSTAFVELTSSEDDIFATFKQRCRRQIRKAEKAGLTVFEPETLEQALAYRPILENFYQSRNLSLENIPTVENQWEMTRKSGTFLLASLEGKIVGGHVVIADGTRAFWLSLASDDQHQKLPKNYTLLWEAMKRCRNQGLKQYDMAGAPSKYELEEGLCDEQELNRFQFKSAFSPDIISLVPTSVIPIRPLDHTILYSLRNLYRQYRGEK